MWGISAVDVLNVIRKAKSEAGVSIKAPVALVLIRSGNVGGGTVLLHPVLSDLKAAGNIHEIREDKNSELPYTSDKGWFKVAVKLANIEEKTVAEHKRNSAQAEYEKIDQDGVLHGAGSPDLTKHTVKVNVARVPESLQRQK